MGSTSQLSAALVAPLAPVSSPRNDVLGWALLDLPIGDGDRAAIGLGLDVRPARGEELPSVLARLEHLVDEAVEGPRAPEAIEIEAHSPPPAATPAREAPA